MNRIIRWLRKRLGRRQPSDHPALPSDWLVIHIPFEERELSTEQRKAIVRMGRWEPPTKPEPPIFEELGVEEQKERARDILKPDPEMAIHIRREDIPNELSGNNERHGKVLRVRAAENIGEILDVFPDEQIEISRSGSGP